jgi:hypothetical protein
MTPASLSGLPLWLRWLPAVELVPSPSHELLVAEALETQNPNFDRVIAAIAHKAPPRERHRLAPPTRPPFLRGIGVDDRARFDGPAR